MSLVEYEYECSRAELLGIPRPTWDEFIAKQESSPPQKNEFDEQAEEVLKTPEANEIQAEEVQNLEEQGEGMRRVGGGLEELNTILANTQHKINKFKTVCGSFTNFMKIKAWKSDVGGTEGETEGASLSMPVTPQRIPGNASKGDVEEEVSSQMDRLDSLINKAERAEISMSCQNKQMRHFLNK